MRLLTIVPPNSDSAVVVPDAGAVLDDLGDDECEDDQVRDDHSAGAAMNCDNCQEGTDDATAGSEARSLRIDEPLAFVNGMRSSCG
jgi:hypothetical protein